MIVEVDTMARLCTRNGESMGPLPVRLVMRYTAADPYAAHFTFGAEGFAEVVWLRLSNRDDCALFALDRKDVARFVRRSYVLVRRGDESQHLDLDACVAALLEPKP